MNLRKILGIFFDFVIIALISGIVGQLCYFLVANEFVIMVLAVICGFSGIFILGKLKDKEDSLGMRLSKIIIKDENKKVTFKDILLFVIFVNVITLIIVLIF